MIITAGKYKGRKIITPDENVTRPTLSKVRMGVFNTLYSLIGDFDDKSFLDVFGGSGVMGLEALSRGFKFVKVYEKNYKAAEIIKKNYRQLGLVPNLIVGDSEALIKKYNEKFDVAYIDPPYSSNLYENILKCIDAKWVILEAVKNIEIENFEILKKKKYGDKYITYLVKKM